MAQSASYEAVSLYQAAKHYRRLGLPVIPLCAPAPDSKGCLHHGPECPHPGKRPLIKWQGRTEVTQDEIDCWWGKRWPNANIGALMGFGLVALDIDPRNGGWEALAAFGLKVPETVTSLTGGGGEHRFFRATQDAPSLVLGPGLEILGRGKLAVVAPSLHKSGRRYQWEIGFGPGEADFAPVPHWPTAPANSAAHSSANSRWQDSPVSGSPHIRNELEQALLSRGGQYQPDGRILVCCPFPDHDEKTPSFYYSPLTGRWWCFGAGHPGRKPDQVCVSGSAYQLRNMLAKDEKRRVFISVITEVFPYSDYRNGHQALSLEYVKEVYNRMTQSLEARLKANNGEGPCARETLSGVKRTLETALEGFVADHRPGGVRVPCLKDGVTQFVHIFPQGCGNPLCPIHSHAKAQENLRPKAKRLGKIRQPALVLFRNTTGTPREVVAGQRKLERHKAYPLRGRSCYKLVLPYRPGTQVAVLCDLAEGAIDLAKLCSMWHGELVVTTIPSEHLLEVLQLLIRQVDLPEAYHQDEDYWLSWLLNTRRMQCARPMGATRCGSAKSVEEDEAQKQWRYSHGNVYGKPLGMLTPNQLESGLAAGFIEDTPFGLIERQPSPRDWQEPPGLHKWKHRTILRRRQREEVHRQRLTLENSEPSIDFAPAGQYGRVSRYHRGEGGRLHPSARIVAGML